MSLANVETRATVMTVEELKIAMNSRDKRAVDFIEQLRKSEPLQVEFAQNQGRDKAKHFVGFVLGEDKDKDSFSAYFMKDNSHHVFQHEGFWHEINTTFIDVETIECEDIDEKHYIFNGMGVFLKEETQRYESGEVFALRYTAHHLDSARQMGSLAAAHAMQ